MDNTEKLKWALEILHREQNNELYGTIAFKMEKGNLICVKIEKTEKPSVT